MNLLDNIQEIGSKYSFKKIILPNGYNNLHYIISQNEEEQKKFNHPVKNDSFLVKKYKSNIPRGWYGFSIGSPTPVNWIDFLDEVLEFLIKKDPEFKIQQIKMKFGSIRFYCSSDKIKDLKKIERYIENLLYDDALIY
ncbi:MAG: hypothetical protein ACOCVF_00670 [bacterium]